MKIIASLRTLTEHCRRLRWMHEENMPSELRDARLVLSEQTIVTDYPVPIIGKPDQVYLMASDCLCLVDTKKRQTPSVFEKDRLQLTIYRTLLRHSSNPIVAGREVLPYAYVRVATSGRPTYVSIDLWGDEVTLAAWVARHRYNQFSQGRDPTFASFDLDHILSDVINHFSTEVPHHA